MKKKKNLIYLSSFLIIGILILSFSSLVIAKEGYSENGYWYYRVEEDPMTDEKTISLILFDEDNTGNNFSNSEADALMIRKLPENKPDLFVGWAKYLADNNKISWRFDKGDVHSGTWITLGEGALLYPADQPKLIDFIKKLLQAEQIAIEVNPDNKLKEASVFKLEGLGEVLLPYLDEFGWKELESVIKE